MSKIFFLHLQMDIETYEWAVIENLLESDMLQKVRQLLVEFHLFCFGVGNNCTPPKENYYHLYRIYTRLRQMGFKEFSTHPHDTERMSNNLQLMSDVLFVNTRFSGN